MPSSLLSIHATKQYQQALTQYAFRFSAKLREFDKESVRCSACIALIGAKLTKAKSRENRKPPAQAFHFELPPLAHLVSYPILRALTPDGGGGEWEF
jgi:hypothetical protein